MIALPANLDRKAFEAGSQPVCSRRPPGSIDVREGVRRVMNSDRYDGSREPAAVRSWVHRLARSADPDLTGSVAGKLWFHPSIHPAFSKLAGSTKDESGQAIAKLNDAQRAKALLKAQVLRDFDLYLQSPAGSHGVLECRERFVRERSSSYTYADGEERKALQLSTRTLIRWQAMYREGGIDALARDGRGRPSSDGPSEEATAMYWSARNDPRKWSIAQCWRMVTVEARKSGWRWFTKLSACRAWDRGSRDTRALTLNRQGEQRYTQTTGFYNEIDPESFSPGECWVGDAKTFDCWVRTPRGQVIRPALVSWQDWRSRTVMGFTIVPHSSEDSILEAFASATEEHGLPAYAIVDNGRDYAAWSWTGGKPKRSIAHKAGEPFDQLDGIFALAGITPSYCLPYSPNGKARLERFHRTIDDQVTRSFPSWCGNCPEDRPEAHAKLVAKAVEWEYFLKAVGRFVAIYNDRAHGADDMQGRSPLQCLALAPRKRVLDDNTRLMLLSKWHRPVSIGRNGVTIRIAGSSQSYGANQPELQELPIGTKVRVAYKPDDLGQIAIWTLAGSFVCQASLNQKLNRKVPSEALREAMRQKGRAKRALKQARKDGLMYLRDPVELALSGLAADGEQRRVPDDPEGGKPNIMPVQSPIETPQRMRKAVGAEELDINQRLAAFNRKGKEAGKGRTESAWSKLCDKYGGRS